jgi:hypothetical protein
VKPLLSDMPQPTFAGSVPETYDRFMGPIFFEPYAEDLVARPTPRLRILDLVKSLLRGESAGPGGY